MGSNSNCIDNNCIFDCCNSRGFCPSTRSGCVHFYDEGLTAGAIVGIIFAILFVIGAGILGVYLCRRWRERNNPPPPPHTVHPPPVYPPPQPQPPVWHEQTYIQRNQYQANPYSPYSNLNSAPSGPSAPSAQPYGFQPPSPSINQHQNLQGNPYSVVSLPISSERQLNAPMSSNPDIQQQINRQDSMDGRM